MPSGSKWAWLLPVLRQQRRTICFPHSSGRSLWNHAGASALLLACAAASLLQDCSSKATLSPPARPRAAWGQRALSPATMLLVTRLRGGDDSLGRVLPERQKSKKKRRQVFETRMHSFSPKCYFLLVDRMPSVRAHAGARMCRTLRRWIGGTPLPRQVVQKLAKRAAAQDMASREKAEAARQAGTLEFNPEDLREFVSSFRKSKLRRKTSAAEAQKKKEREAAKKAGAEQRAEAKRKVEEARRLQEAHRVERAKSIRPGCEHLQDVTCLFSSCNGGRVSSLLPHRPAVGLVPQPPRHSITPSAIELCLGTVSDQT